MGSGSRAPHEAFRLALRSMLATLAIVIAPRTSPAVTLPSDFVDEQIVGGLDQPLDMAFLPDGRVLFVEQKTGSVRLLVNGHIAAIDPILVVPALNGSGSERGLQGIAVDRLWPSRPYVYFVYNRTGNQIRLVRYTASGALTDPQSQTLTLSSPLILIDDIPDAAMNHNGGTLRFGPDGFLYLSLGEDFVECAAQDSTLLQGVVLQLDVSRLPPGAGGPVPRALLIPPQPMLASPDSNAKLVFAYGLRNPWRFCIDPWSGLLYVGDVGDATWEELDEVSGGMNLGWPFREANAIRYPGGCSEPGGSGRGGYAAPITTVSHAAGGVAILCAGVYRTTSDAPARWPVEYYGNVFYSDYYSGWLRRLQKSGSQWSLAPTVPGQSDPSNWGSGFTSPVVFTLAADGCLWWISQFDAASHASSGSIHRIRYAGMVLSVPADGAAQRALRGEPNPFTVSTTIGFRLPAATPVQLAVYDIRGRRVRTLWRGPAVAGETRVTWNAVDDAGVPVAPGIYFVRLDEPAAASTLRLLLLK